ncbi:MAG: F0F1 ATP synthase subunit A [Pirellulales bacterium]
MASEHGGKHDPFDPAHLFGHVKDATYFEVPKAIDADGKLEIPQPIALTEPIMPAHGSLEAFDLRITKFMVLEVVAAILVAVAFIWLANRIRGGARTTGRLANLLEAMVVFIRDQVARPAIGRHDADRFVPLLWTIFFFVLACNLLGMVPWAGSPTGALATTGALALISFATTVGAGMAKLGPVGFWTGQVPHMDLPFVLAIGLKPMVFVIEILGLVIKHGVLAIRLLANMMAGHLVLAVIMAFIVATAGNMAWYGVATISVLGATALSLLELFVAFLQAFIFTFLSALFIGMAVHPH